MDELSGRRDDNDQWLFHSSQEGKEEEVKEELDKEEEVVESRTGSIPPPCSGDVLMQSQASLKINDQSQTSRPAVRPRLETLLTASKG